MGQKAGQVLNRTAAAAAAAAGWYLLPACSLLSAFRHAWSYCFYPCSRPTQLSVALRGGQPFESWPQFPPLLPRFCLALMVFDGLAQAPVIM